MSASRKELQSIARKLRIAHYYRFTKEQLGYALSYMRTGKPDMVNGEYLHCALACVLPETPQPSKIQRFLSKVVEVVKQANDQRKAVRPQVKELIEAPVTSWLRRTYLGLA